MAELSVEMVELRERLDEIVTEMLSFIEIENPTFISSHVDQILAVLAPALAEARDARAIDADCADENDLAYERLEEENAALKAQLAEARAAERERCAKVAEQGHCTHSGCDPQTTGHSDLCPIGIAAAIRGLSPSARES